MTLSTDVPQLKVLIIEDDSFIRGLCKALLQKLNYSVYEAENGNSGVALFQQELPDIVITDILMPDKEGLETISEIKAINPKAKIIAMSGGGETQNMTFLQLAQRIGANEILQKPFKPDQLLTAIKNISAG